MLPCNDDDSGDYHCSGGDHRPSIQMDGLRVVDELIRDGESDGDFSDLGLDESDVEGCSDDELAKSRKDKLEKMNKHDNDVDVEETNEPLQARIITPLVGTPPINNVYTDI